jgi:hypothetical protein
MNTSSSCHVLPGYGRLRRSLLTKSVPHFRHQSRMLSWVTTMPRCQDQLNVARTETEHVMQPDGMADNLGWKPMLRKRGGLACHAVWFAHLPLNLQQRLTWQCPWKPWPNTKPKAGRLLDQVITRIAIPDFRLMAV